MMDFIKKEKTFLLFAVLILGLTGFVIYKQLSPVPTSAPGITLPAGFPLMPLYPKAKLIDSKTDPGEGALYIGIKYGAAWEVKDTVPTVAKWYKDKLQELKWTLDTQSTNPEAKDVQSASFYNDEYTLNMSFTLEPDGKTTKITAEFNSHMRDICDDSNGKICK